jgi:fatty acid desaturase
MPGKMSTGSWEMGADRMDDFIGVRGVMRPRRLRELSKRSDIKGLAQLTSHYGAIAANTLALALTWGSWWCVPFFVFQGILINQLYAAEHECDHGTVFRTRWLNLWGARVSGFWILHPSDYHKWSHFAHHRHTQDWDKDPELTGRKPFASAWPYLWRFWGPSHHYYRAKAVLRQAFGHVPETFLTDRQGRLIVLAARWHLVGYAAIAASAVAFASWWPVIYWLGPILCTKWFYWFQGLGEHTGLTHRPITLLNTRTFKTNAFMRWINWNMAYHTVHHTYPNIPFHALPRLHAEVKAIYPFPLAEESHFGCQWRILRELLRGRTEHDIVADHDARLAQAVAAE